jgi:hypothetical protein
MEELLQITVVRNQGFLVRRAGFSGVVREWQLLNGEKS